MTGKELQEQLTWKIPHIAAKAPEQVKEDQEGIRNLRMLAKNMIWFLRCKEAGEKLGVPQPKYD